MLEHIPTFSSLLQQVGVIFKTIQHNTTWTQPPGLVTKIPAPNFPEASQYFVFKWYMFKQLETIFIRIF